MIHSADDTLEEYLRSLNVLCVEDSELIQFLYESILNGKVKTVLFADNGAEGLERFRSEPIDIIITDYSMPSLNGIEMIEQIRAADPKIPIILVTGIEEMDVVVKALQLNVNNFIKKPITLDNVTEALQNVAKLKLADKILEDQKEHKLKVLEEKTDYMAYQEELAFAKELNILRNDYYYQMLNIDHTVLIDFFYKPLDTLSGDAYSTRRVDAARTFCLIVDGMGKGLSASLSAILLTSYVNHLIDTMEFDLRTLVERAIEYMRPILLDEEAISAEFILLDCSEGHLTYAKFSMPPSLVQTQEGEVHKIRSNNPPLSKYTRDFELSTFNAKTATKFMFYSDGIIENTLKDQDRVYARQIENDFMHSLTKEEMKQKFLEAIDTQEDDVTFIFIHKLETLLIPIEQRSFPTRLDTLEQAGEWYAQLWRSFTSDEALIGSAEVVFSELFMNAYEHGNLGLDTKQKQQLLEEDTYFEALKSLEVGCSRSITVTVHQIVYQHIHYVLTVIADEGDGFDTNILSHIFRHSYSYNGRGVFVSRRSSLGIYYNAQGNTVLFLHKLTTTEEQ